MQKIMELLVAIEQFKCTVCQEIPSENVFQCTGGHPVCCICESTLVHCPRCGVPFGTVKIRNREMEFMLDMMEFPCTNMNNGCEKLLSRTSIRDHNKSCKFRKSINLCKLIGYKCTHQTFAKQVDSLALHLISNHGAKVHYGSEVQLIQEFRPPSSSSVFWEFVHDMIWTPVIVHSERRFTLLSFANGTNQTLTWICLILDDDVREGEKELQCHLELSIIATSQAQPTLQFREQCVKYMEAEDVLVANPLQVPLSFLRKGYIKDCSLTLKVSITTDSCGGRSTLNGNLQTIRTVCSPVESRMVNLEAEAATFFA